MDNPVDLEKMEKRLEWLDNEHRNDKTVIASLQSKIESLNSENTNLKTRLAETESEITRLSTLMARLEQFELDIDEIRTEVNRRVDDLEDSIREKHIQTEKNQQQIEDLKETSNAIQKQLPNFDEIFEAIDSRKEEDFRLSRLIEDLKTNVNEIEDFIDEYKRSLRVIEENRRQDTKRLTDIQGEITGIRKRQDETRGKQDLVENTMRKLDSRIKNLQDAESERRESQTAFIEKINLMEVERDRVFKEWSERFEKMEKITADLEEEITKIESTHRSVKESQAALDEVTQRFERRINEITEIQRLNEDRFRQEWTTFKSDDQKRWSNYSLAQEEQYREIEQDLEDLGSRITTLEDLLQDLKERFQQVGKDDIKRMQGLLNRFRESIETYNSIFKE